jgi:hypothetical protein
VEHPNLAEYVRIEHAPRQVGGHLGGRDEAAVVPARLDAGVVDQHVEPAVGLDFLGGRVDRRVVGHVKPHETSTEPSGGVPSPFRTPGADVNSMTRGQKLAGRLEAQALVGPGDQGDRHANLPPNH